MESLEKYVTFYKSKQVRLMANSGTKVLLFTSMAVNMNGEKPLQNMMMEYSIHKGSFPNFIAPNRFLKKI